MFKISGSLKDEAQKIIESLAGKDVEKQFIIDMGFFITTNENQPKNVAFLGAIDFNGKRYLICTEVKTGNS